MNDYTAVYSCHTALVGCGKCFSVLRASDRDAHDQWHRVLAQRDLDDIDLAYLRGLRPVETLGDPSGT